MRFTLTLLLALAMTPASAELLVRDAWVRATPPGARTAAAYFIIENSGPEDALISASADVAEDAQLHTHRHDEGMMRMEQVEAFVIPANESLLLAPGGNHLMMMGLEGQLVPGEEVNLKLGFKNHSPIMLTAPVKDGRKK